MNAYTGLNTGNNSFVPSGTTHYRERVSYDGNGNILSYLRNGEGTNTSMDNLSYAYNLSGGWLQNNKLRHVTDAVTTTPTGYGDLKNGQVSDNYGYDAIGNLVKDESEGIASGGIEWNVYGKISQITKTNGGVTTVIKYTYDATGNRIGKWVQVGAGTPKQTAYVRDASGNVMAIYEKGNSEVNGGLLSQIEVPLYGSSRLGVWRPDREVETTGWELFDTDPMTGTGGGIAGGWERGRVQFELSNHLGNVLVTISDVRIPVLVPEGIELCDDPVHPACYRPIDYYLPQILTANDYYPFGMIMPGRKYAFNDTYRYGFNGKENDNDVKGEGGQQDYGMRIYDPRLGRFLSVDPLTKKYSELTPYQFASNRPIQGVDLDGKEVFLVTRSGNGFFLFGGAEIGGGIAFGKDGIALVAYQTYKLGIGFELGVALNGTVYPGMENLADLDGVAMGGSISGAFIGKFGLSASNSSGNWGATVSVGIGAGAHASVDASITFGLKIITWKEIVSKVSQTTEEGKVLQRFFGINDENKGNSEGIVKDFYVKMVTGLKEKRAGDLKSENEKNNEIIKKADAFLEDYKKSGLLYRLTTIFEKKQIEKSKKEAEKSIQQNNEEIKVLEDIEVKF